MTPYEALRALAEEELELVLDGRFADVAALSGRMNELAAGLPATPPSEAGPELEAAQNAVRSAVAATLAARDARRRGLRHLQTGRAALRSYRPGRPGAVERRG